MASVSRAVFVLLVSLALCQAVAGLASEQNPKPVERIQKAFKEMTELSDILRVDTLRITLYRDPQQGEKLFLGFRSIIVKITEVTARLDGTAFGYNPKPLSDADALLVVQGLTTFVTIQQALLDTVIGRRGEVTLFPFFGPIRAALVSLEVAIDTFAYFLIDLIPTQEPAADELFSKLLNTVRDAELTYNNSSLVGATMAQTQTGAKLVDVILKAFKDITQLSDNLLKDTEKINNFNAGRQGLKIAQGFGVIIVKVTAASAALAPGAGANPSALSDDDAQLVVDALTTFVRVHQALLNVVIGKHGLFALIPFFEPIRVSLVQLELVVDTLAFYLIDLIPTQKPKATQEVRGLVVTIGAAVTTYSTRLSKSTLALQAIEGLIDH